MTPTLGLAEVRFNRSVDTTGRVVSTLSARRRRELLIIRLVPDRYIGKHITEIISIVLIENYIFAKIAADILFIKNISGFQK